MEYTEQQLRDIRDQFAKGATDTQFNNFILLCKQRNLSPLSGHIYFQLRKAREWNEEVRAYEFVKKASYQTSIDAFRLIAQRSGEYKGQDPAVYIYSQDGKFTESTIQLDDPDDSKKPLIPWAVRVGVYRKGFEKPIQVTARFEAYAVYVKDSQRGWVLNNMWERRGPEQLEKCAEALALRKAFPEELGGIYLAEELHDDQEETAPIQANSAVPVQANSVVTPEVNHTPAEGKEEARPDKSRSETKRKKAQKAEVPNESRQSGEVGAISEIQNGDATRQAPTVSSTGAAPAQPETPVQGENPTPAPTPSTPLSKEERTKFVNRLRGFVSELHVAGLEKEEATESIRNYIMGFFGKPAQQLDFQQAQELIDRLEKSSAAGELVKLVKGAQ